MHVGHPYSFNEMSRRRAPGSQPASSKRLDRRRNLDDGQGDCLLNITGAIIWQRSSKTPSTASVDQDVYRLV